MTTQQAADLLGVKPETVYAYVSRGVLARVRGEDRRSSQFDRIEVERLAKRNRRGGRAGSLEVVIDTELTLLDPAGALYYRGYDAVELARTSRFEDVAELLWAELLWAEPAGSGGGPSEAPRPRRSAGRMSYDRAWHAPTAAVRVARRAQNSLPASAPAIDRMRVVVAAFASCDPMRHDRRPAAVTAAARAVASARSLHRRAAVVAPVRPYARTW
jgi:citrate synthase